MNNKDLFVAIFLALLASGGAKNMPSGAIVDLTHDILKTINQETEKL